MELNDKNLALVGISLAGIVTVASASSHFDLLDTAIGIIMLMMLRSSIKEVHGDRGTALFVSAVAGMSTLLVFGIPADILNQYLSVSCGKLFQGFDNSVGFTGFRNGTSHYYLQMLYVVHFVIWIIASLFWYFGSIKKSVIARSSD